MRGVLITAGSLALAIVSGVPAGGATWKLDTVTYPEKRSVEVPFARTEIAPKAAELSAKVRFEGGQAQIDLKWEKMEPAVLFAGNITTYALWAVTRDGRPENLGEVPVRDKKSGSVTFRTGQKSFAMVVTAEVLPGSLAPTELVVFTSGKVDPKTSAVNTDVSIDYDCPYGALVKAGNPSLAALTYTPGGEPIELQQARKAMDMAEALGAAKVDEKAMTAAKTQLSQAVNAASGGSKQIVVDYSRRALENAGVAIRSTLVKRQEEKLAAEAARRQAAEEAKRRELEAAKAQAGAAEAQARSANADKARMASEVERLKAERDAIKKSLQDSVGKVMAITEEARGTVVSMGDITFDVNKSTLKRDAEISVAKISGILAVFSKFNIRVEGFTDNTGKQDLNMKLSAERARTVADFLVAQGIEPARLTHAGYGPASPVASNDTAEGRGKNRRVELIINEGPIEPTPGGMVAPERPAKPAAKPAAAPKKPAEPKKAP